MKRLIFILAVVCTVFIGFGSVGLAFDNGCTLDGVTIKIPENNANLAYFNSCSYYIRLASGKFYFGQYPFTIITGSSRIYWSDSESVRLCYGNGNLTTFTSKYISSNPSNIVSSNHDILDETGAVFFPPTPPAEVPEVTVPVPEGIAAVQIIPQAITSNLAVLIPLGLVVLAILLGMRLLPRLVALFLR